MDIIQSPLKRRIISLTKKNTFKFDASLVPAMNGYIHNITLILVLFQDHWLNALQTLELSLEEVVHIR